METKCLTAFISFKKCKFFFLISMGKHICVSLFLFYILVFSLWIVIPTRPPFRSISSCGSGSSFWKARIRIQYLESLNPDLVFGKLDSGSSFQKARIRIQFLESSNPDRGFPNSRISVRIQSDELFQNPKVIELFWQYVLTKHF